MEHNNDEIEIDLRRLVRALWSRVWLLLLAAVLAGAVALGGASVLIRPLYKAEALMYVNSSNISVGGTKVSISQSELTAAQTLVDTYIVILNTRTTLEDVIAQSGVSYTYEELMEREMIHAEAVNGTEVFSVEVTSPDPGEAELLANTIARILPEKIASIVEGSSARIVDYAVEPTRKASPDLVRITAVGAILGFLLAGGTVVIIEVMDEKIHGPDYLLQTYALPVLAVIPDLQTESGTNEYRQHRKESVQKGG